MVHGFRLRSVGTRNDFLGEVEEMLLNDWLQNFGGLMEVGHLDYPGQQFHFQLKNEIFNVDILYIFLHLIEFEYTNNGLKRFLDFL